MDENKFRLWKPTEKHLSITVTIYVSNLCISETDLQKELSIRLLGETAWIQLSSIGVDELRTGLLAAA